MSCKRFLVFCDPADWVILSACNTAAGDEPGAEGLSGLAKAFFYAGARALLVSHWSVPSEAEAAEHPGIARAEALKRSMLALMNDRENDHTLASDMRVSAPFPDAPSRC